MSIASSRQQQYSCLTAYQQGPSCAIFVLSVTSTIGSIIRVSPQLEAAIAVPDSIELPHLDTTGEPLHTLFDLQLLRGNNTQLSQSPPAERRL